MWAAWVEASCEVRAGCRTPRVAGSGVRTGFGGFRLRAREDGWGVYATGPRETGGVKVAEDRLATGLQTLRAHAARHQSCC